MIGLGLQPLQTWNGSMVVSDKERLTEAQGQLEENSL